MVNALLMAGTYIYNKNDSGVALIASAAMQGKLGLVKALAAIDRLVADDGASGDGGVANQRSTANAGAAPGSIFCGGMTALHYVAATCMEEDAGCAAVEALLVEGASLLAQDELGRTPCGAAEAQEEAGDAAGNAAFLAYLRGKTAEEEVKVKAEAAAAVAEGGADEKGKKKKKKGCVIC